LSSVADGDFVASTNRGEDKDAGLRLLPEWRVEAVGELSAASLNWWIYRPWRLDSGGPAGM